VTVEGVAHAPGYKLNELAAFAAKRDGNAHEGRNARAVNCGTPSSMTTTLARARLQTDCKAIVSCSLESTDGKAAVHVET